MAKFKFDDLTKEYSGFNSPFVNLEVNGNRFSDNKSGLVLADVDIELTSGFEASVATFHIYNAFDSASKKFSFKNVEKYITLGSAVNIGLGYSGKGRWVFMGFITKVNFIYNDFSVPSVEVTAMDVKSIMMAETGAYQLKATDYGSAVREIFQKPIYRGLVDSKAITKIDVQDTPDRGMGHSGGKDSAFTIDMVNESDYEFVVRAAKRFNYEFFTENGTVRFRKAKKPATTLMEIGPQTAMKSFNVGYDITGVVATVEARSMDVGKGELINAKKTVSNKLSSGSRAGKMIKKTQKVYIDPTVNSKKEAEYRVNSLMEDISYRFGTLEAEMAGIPEFFPGYFVDFKGVGDNVSNSFYITNVHHILENDKGFHTVITGKAATLGGSGAMGLAGAAGLSALGGFGF